MSGQGPGANSRGRGGKFKKYTRGGGKHFSRDLRPLDADGNEISMWSDQAQKNVGVNSEEEEEDSEEEDSDEEKNNAAGAGPQSREDRKAEKKARKDAAIAKAKAAAVRPGDLPPSDSEEEEDSDDAAIANPNHSKAARNRTKLARPSADDDVDDAAEGVKGLSVGGTPNRKERQSAEAKLAKERYRKLHEAGKTDEARADLERLKAIRAQRELDAANRAAEQEERDERSKRLEAERLEKEQKKREAALGKPAAGKKGKK